MKSKRHNRILEIINKKEIETQEELAEELKKSGFEVTQATISRDIKILKLLKVQSISGKYRYVAPTKEERNINDKLFSILANSAISVEKVDKFVVVKTLTGAASAAAEAIDSLYSEDIAGTIAGDNTIFILIRTDEKALELIRELGLPLGILQKTTKGDLEAEVEALIAERQQARKDRNFALADKIRDELKARGIELLDTPQGVRWKKVD